MAANGTAVMLDFEEQLDHLDSTDFARVASFLHAETGIKLSGPKKTMVEGRLRRRVRALGLDNLTDYVAMVFDSGCANDEAINLIDALTTNKTDFFREPAHFDFLTNTLLPEFAARGDVTKIWSAACSTGAEPYTLAMVMSDFAQRAPGWQFSVLASDICTEALSAAKRAVYPEEMMDPVPMEARRRYVLRSSDPGKKTVRMAGEIRDLVSFARVNLIADRYPVERDMDVIFCRNILIYFDRPTQEMVIRRLCSYLKPGGYLVLGHTDSIAGLSISLEWLGNSIFRRA